MQPMPDSYRLQRRGQTYYYYRRVPAELVPVYGRAFIKESLHTKEKSEARKLRALHDVKWDARFAATQMPNSEGIAAVPPAAAPGLCFEDLVDYLRAVVASDDARTSKELAAAGSATAEQLENMRQEAENTISILSDPTDPERDERLSHFQTYAAKAAGVTDLINSDEAEEISRRALLEIYRRKLARYNHNFADQPFDALFAPKKNPTTLLVKDAVDILMKECTEDATVNGKNGAWVDKQKAILLVIQDYLGSTFNLSKIDDEHVQGYRSLISSLPTNKAKHYPGLSILQVVDQAKMDGRATLSFNTQKPYLDAFKLMLALAVRRKVLPNNPAIGVQPLKKAKLAASDLRAPFTEDQLKAIFLSDFYHRCAPSSASPYKASDRNWRMWLPLLMLYSCARPNEIAQLRTDHVRKTPAGTWYLDLETSSAEGNDVQLKTAASARRIPLHRTLLEIGFLKFALTRRDEDGAETDLFPELKPNKYGNRAWYASKRLNEHYLPQVIKVKPRQSLYSLRHNARDALRRVGAPADALKAIAGWSPTSGTAVSDYYGDPYNPDLHVKWVNMIEYDGLDLSFLHSDPTSSPLGPTA